MNFGTSPQSVGAMASRLADYEINNDADIAQGAMLARDFALAAANILDAFGDNVYTALFMYDRQTRRIGRTRAQRVVAPLRHYTRGVRFAHRFMMAVVLKYRKEYAEDINAANAGKRKQKFQPGKAA